MSKNETVHLTIWTEKMINLAIIIHAVHYWNFIDKKI